MSDERKLPPQAVQPRLFWMAILLPWGKTETEAIRQAFCQKGRTKRTEEIGRGGRIMMVVVEKKPVPIYEAKCGECKSVIRYWKSDVGVTHYITCPVCKMSIWADVRTPEDTVGLL